MTRKPYDILGVGFGPGNLALAISLEELLPGLDVHFLDAAPGPSWQQSMMLHRANIQHHPSIDLATPRNPRSRYTFNNYLFENDLLFKHFNLGLEYPLRKDYARYVVWAAKQFAQLVDYEQRVDEIALDSAAAGAPSYRVRTRTGDEYAGRILVLATGRTPYIPPVFAELRSERILHLMHYLDHIDELIERRGARRIAVIGASQSAVEILLDLSQRHPEVEVLSYLRHFGFRLKDTSPFMEASVHPEYVEPFYRASAEQKRQINEDLRYLNYSAADMDVLKDLALTLYEHELDGREQIQIINNHHLRSATLESECVRLIAEHRYEGTVDEREVDAVVLATGFRDLGPDPQQERFPALLAPLMSKLRTDASGVLHVNLDYSVSPRDAGSELPPMFLNGLCEGSHGVSDAGSFSLLSLRSKKLVEAIARRLDRQLSA
ncbi:lysine N(6)-hydroxylase/L-ornithine N(5)-oxygenase family protein [Haliangium ochraceum]|uniref:Lysine N6-hydroxylase/L-ornithine N5-oxygenase family protein n=1 Tax=Haliangium ochraceum (strain DSM 14365 / JCM 11303 / SMP-2) TaxID=502025 RepID=D0LLE4_HALO1|nr:SidA/IucD/PvdA family monooxygenase [Haliangium ochraceum]ACY18640.1 lysine N6-hydroxylase/L-ornithine N5-oxygenase family protein [Haliangium ochraceum DSM 14365]